MDDLPGIEVEATIYLISDSTGQQCRTSIDGLTSSRTLAGLANAACHIVRHPTLIIKDWRPMTRAEIADYKAEEAEDRTACH